MSIISTDTRTPSSTIHSEFHDATPSFFGILGGELFKIFRQWTTWILLVLLAGIIFLPYLLTFTVTNVAANLHDQPYTFLNNRMESNIDILRVFIGIFLLVLTARVIGLEYQLGTIRILLARGVGRLQLFSAKVLAITIIALVVFAAALVLNVILMCGTVLLISGNFAAFKALDTTFWADMRIYLVTVLISMGVTILMASALSVLGRSLSFALSASLAWFPCDNFGTIFLILANRLTHSDFWLNVSAYLLGPNLNVMPSAVLNKQALTIGLTPFVTVDGTHTLLVTLIYALIFAAVAIVLTWRRDVKE